MKLSHSHWVVLALGTSSSLALSMIGCGADDTSGDLGAGTAEAGVAPSNNEEAKQFFIDKVYPDVSATCGECHSTGQRGAPVYFAPKDAKASYGVLEGFPGMIAPPQYSPFMQKGVHSGPALTSQQVEVVTKWLEMEASARKLGGQARFPNARTAFLEVGKCMSYDKWVEAGLSQIANTSSDIGPCDSCHSQGYAGFFMSGDPRKDFDKARQFPYIQRFVSGTVDDLGAFERAIYANRYVKKPLLFQSLALNHPAYTPNPRLAEALERYFQDVIRETERTFQRGESCKPAEIPTGDAGADAQ